MNPDFNHSLPPRGRRLLFGLLTGWVFLTGSLLLAASALPEFNVPAGDATQTLKTFAAQAGREIVFVPQSVQGARTKAIEGRMEPRAALHQMLGGTELVAREDERTGAFAVRPLTEQEKNGSGEALTASSGLPTTENEAMLGLVQMHEYRVLGSRIRTMDTVGPSPFDAYDQDYIRASGAMTLADFLNRLPQNYAGVSAGRSSAPNEFNPEFGQRTETTLPLFNYIMGSSAAPPGQTGVSGVSLRGLGSGSTLVLVDGRRLAQSGAGNRASDTQQGFVNLNTIPLGMIERIEVTTDGASAIYGADAVGGVVNIVLKKNWKGTEALMSVKVAEQGGGGVEKNATLTSGLNWGKLRGTISFDYYKREALSASDRSFSANQDHSSVVAGYSDAGEPIYGRDLRLNWGYPTMVQAYSGTLNGIAGPDGNPTRYAVLNPGVTGDVTLADFTGSAGGFNGGASQTVRGNTSGYIDLIPQSERSGVSGNFTYALNDRIEAYAMATYSTVHGVFNSQPPVTAAATYSGFGNVRTVVPAAYNPFGQDVVVGLYHAGFGSIAQTTDTEAFMVSGGVRGSWGATWQWDLGVNYQHQDHLQVTRDMDTNLITAALINPDPTLRLNPFLDASANDPVQQAIYESMAIYPTIDSTSELQSVDFQADGQVFELPGGPVRTAVGGTFNHAENSSDSVSYSSGFSGLIERRQEVEGRRDSYAAFAEVAVPVVGKENARLLLQRLDLSLAGRYENQGSYSSSVPKFGVTWVPTPAILLRASYSESYRAPGLTEYEVATSSYSGTVTDPLRSPASTSGVTISSGANENADAETSQNEVYGLILEPPFIPGLSLQLNYYSTQQQNVLQRLTATTILNNEALFPERVTRADPTADDLALNQPGRLLELDTTFVNFGEVVNESLDYRATYRLADTSLGNWQFGLSATQTLKSSRQLAPNSPPVVDDGDTYAPPEWKLNASVFWNHGPLNATLFFTYLDGFETNAAGNSLASSYPIPSVTKVDLNVGYKIERPVLGGLFDGVRVQVGVENLFDKDPPFSDTVFGYNGALHSNLVMGRTYTLSLVANF